MIEAVISFGVLLALFTPLERAFPARRQSILRRDWGTDLLFFAGQYLVWTAAISAALYALYPMLSALTPFGAQVRAWPLGAQAVVVVLGGDLLIYWVHRAQHRWDILWRFHGVHHTAERLDWLAAHREHPVDGLITQTVVNLPAMILGFSFAPIAGFVAFRGLWAIYIHTNVRLPIGPARWILGCPSLHHWHHAKGRFVGNYGNLNPLMDLAFGTYRRPDHEPLALGTEEPWPRGYFAQLLHPFVRRKP